MPVTKAQTLVSGLVILDAEPVAERNYLTVSPPAARNSPLTAWRNVEAQCPAHHLLAARRR